MDYCYEADSILEGVKVNKQLKEGNFVIDPVSPKSASLKYNFCMNNLSQFEAETSGGSFIMKDRERDILRRTILELLMKGSVHYTDLDKKVCATCHSFATTNTFKSQLHYLLNNDYIERITRGIYQITPKGKKYLALLTI